LRGNRRSLEEAPLPLAAFYDPHLGEAKSHTLTFRERLLWAPPTITSSQRIEGDARNELMRLSLDGRLKGFAAMPVREWHKKIKKARL
jgi:hypothetical protein